MYGLVTIEPHDIQDSKPHYNQAVQMFIIIVSCMHYENVRNVWLLEIFAQLTPAWNVKNNAKLIAVMLDL